MVEIFWITNEDHYSSLRNLLEKGSRESIRTLSTEKLVNYKEDLPAFSILCFEVNDEFFDFVEKYEYSLDDKLVVAICPPDRVNELVKLSEELTNKNRFHLTIDPSANEFTNSQNFRTIIKLSSLCRGAQEFSQVGKNINKLVTSTLSEVERLRKLHSRLVNLRSESIKGIKVSSKFASGEASGGEFFDMIVGDGQMLILMSSTSSYVTTSVLLSHIEVLRSLKAFTKEDIQKYIQIIRKDLSEDADLDLMFMIIDNKNLNMQLFNFGQVNILDSQKYLTNGNDLQASVDNIQECLIECKLERDSKLFILSPGIIKMTAGIINNLPVTDFFKAQSMKSSSEILNELFFHLKKNTDDMFLKRDASALIIEVGSNVIVEV